MIEWCIVLDGGYDYGATLHAFKSNIAHITS